MRSDSTAANRTGDYVLGAGEHERARLLEQCEVHRAEAESLFDRLGVAPGWWAADVGCGPLGVLDILADRVGRDGVAVGVERDRQMLRMARASLSERGLTDVQLVRADAATPGFTSDSFDLVHERLLLVNVVHPEDIAAEMVRLARPGGYVALQNIDHFCWTCQPPHPAWDALKAGLAEAWVGNPCIGRQLPALLREAGLAEVNVAAYAHVLCPGHPYQKLLLHLVGLYRERIVATGALTADELDTCVRELDGHLDRPDTFSVATFFQAWGSKPKPFLAEPVRSPTS